MHTQPGLRDLLPFQSKLLLGPGLPPPTPARSDSTIPVPEARQPLPGLGAPWPQMREPLPRPPEMDPTVVQPSDRRPRVRSIGPSRKEPGHRVHNASELALLGAHLRPLGPFGDQTERRPVQMRLAAAPQAQLTSLPQLLLHGPEQGTGLSLIERTDRPNTSRPPVCGSLLLNPTERHRVKNPLTSRGLQGRPHGPPGRHSRPWPPVPLALRKSPL